MHKAEASRLFIHLSIFFTTTILAMSLLAAITGAESMDMMTENIPDTDIIGATGGAGEFISEISPGGTMTPFTNADPYGSTPIMPSEDAPAPQNVTENTAEENNGSIFGVIIAIAIAVSLIMLILAFIPKGKVSDSKNDRGNENKM